MDLEKRKDALVARGAPDPVGWASWDGGAQWRWVQAQEMRLKRTAAAARFVKHRAKTEVFHQTQYIASLSPLPETEGYVPVPGKPRYIIRAFYGPVAGVRNSMILTLNYREEYLEYNGTPLRTYDGPTETDQFGVRQEITDIVARYGDGAKEWGPREFLFRVVQAIRDAKGDCIIMLTHNRQVVEVDSVEFENWVKDKDPTEILLPLLGIRTSNPQLVSHDRREEGREVPGAGGEDTPHSSTAEDPLGAGDHGQEDPRPPRPDDP